MRMIPSELFTACVRQKVALPAFGRYVQYSSRPQFGCNSWQTQLKFFGLRPIMHPPDGRKPRQSQPAPAG